MTKYIIRRIFYLILTLFIVASVTFFLMKFLPGTPYSNQAKLQPSQIAIMNQKYGLNKPLWDQYLIYMGNLLHGNLGTSFQFNNQPVTQLIAHDIGPSMQIGTQAMIVGSVLGILLGAVAAIKKNTWVDSGATFISILGISIPSFVLAVLLQYYFGYKLQWFPVALWQNFSSSILPTLALAAFPLANVARFMRTEMVDVLDSDYIELAKAKGDSERKTITHHALRNSLIPVITIVGPMAVSIMTGSLVVENIFSIPGIGNQFVQSILTNDYPTIMGLTIFYSFLLVVIILVVDILYGIIDPRIRLGNGGKE
ncbi:oligopeptide ABC transporter permease [Fructilactobacillus fructivorans]|uniref:ABC transporter permease subunit n=1 Tax=Fructilactobacillus fructivorans TaxID=1614 RepID=A0A0C1M7C9_9LACO|nr:oligopeptide ABC transporter permease [Fructilactobacillus fructivorans]KID42309.1 Oligopeptide transport system permease protein OppB [Fructilactobacillus fructivorans]MCT0151072.1 ABC transporter permease [Fructilactobacillus fructivorans]MCT2867370.1 ABC transporter permease [Fructilactobacillus fructivorans]MCT2869111.1 ABC transporter permease [Fructilactobacillus fructivorans]MCT2873169.1 ABC transporter permease [Fructilactobacillus fructivorans]